MRAHLGGFTLQSAATTLQQRDSMTSSCTEMSLQEIVLYDAIQAQIEMIKFPVC